MDANTNTASVPALAVAYFAGYSAAEARLAVGFTSASLHAVAEGFSSAVGRRAVAREAWRAWEKGWRNAEALLS